jgi:hypothetical protein
MKMPYKYRVHDRNLERLLRELNGGEMPTEVQFIAVPALAEMLYGSDKETHRRKIVMSLVRLPVKISQ